MRSEPGHVIGTKMVVLFGTLVVLSEEGGTAEQMRRVLG